MSSNARDMHPRSEQVSRPPKQATLTAQRIVQDIQSRGLEPGARLAPEKEMLEKYGVGRGTLREALRVLEIQGVLTIRPGPGGGPVVTAPDSRHLASTLALLMQFAKTPFGAVIEARLHIEPITAGLCAKESSGQLIRNLRDSIDKMEENVGDVDTFLDENQRFHDLIAWGSGNPLFAYFINSLHWIIDGTVLGVDYPMKYREVVLRAHEEVVEGIESGSFDAAYYAMFDHMRDSQKYFETKFSGLLTQELSWELYGA